MRLPVIKDAGFRCVGFVSDPPGDFKAEQMLLSLFICQPSGTVSPVPDQGIGRTDTAPVENAEAVPAAEKEVPAPAPYDENKDRIRLLKQKALEAQKMLDEKNSSSLEGK